MVDSVPLQVDQQEGGVHLLHLFEVCAENSGEVKCVLLSNDHQVVSHTQLVVFPEIFGEPVTDEDEITTLGSPKDEEEADDESDNICPAYIICGPQDCTALIGGQVMLEVIYGGHPEPLVKWLKAVSYEQAD